MTWIMTDCKIAKNILIVSFASLCKSCRQLYSFGRYAAVRKSQSVFHPWSELPIRNSVASKGRMEPDGNFKKGIFGWIIRYLWCKYDQWSAHRRPLIIYQTHAFFGNICHKIYQKWLSIAHFLTSLKVASGHADHCATKTGIAFRWVCLKIT